MKRITSVILFASLSLLVWGQNPVSITVEKSDATSASYNLKNINGFWHINGPRSYENNNNLSIFWNNGTYKRYLTILDTGNVGIGKINPSQKLDVNGNVKISTTGGSDRLLQIENVYRTWNFVANGYDFVIKDSNDAEDWLRIDGNHNWLKLGGESFYLNSAGNVGIGTDDPKAKLDVAGNIKAQEIEVALASMQDLNLNGTLAANNITYTTNGQTADHVFEADYNLRSLEEIEAFILENKHLPDVPSAAAMEEEGVNLAEMNKLLLQKVEELTLYVIEKDKKIKLLETENKRQKVELDVQNDKVVDFEERLMKLEQLLVK